MSEHATLPPSGAEQWGHCAGSVKAQAALTSVETEEQRRGTAAHWVGSTVLESFRLGTVLRCDSFVGRSAPNAIIIDEELAEGAQTWVDSVVDQIDSLSVEMGFDLRDRLLIEHRVYMPQIHPTENWGTLDTALYVPGIRRLFIWDYKNGNRDCQAEGNLQLADYLAGLVEYFQIDSITEQHTEVVARIVQPFCYYSKGPIKEWVFTLSDLRSEWNHLSAQAHEALGPNPRLTTGKWCTDCDAVGVCAAARQAGYNFIDVVKGPYHMDQMAGADLATERLILQDGLSVGKARLEAIEDEIGHRVRKGESDSGLTLETSRGREKWNIPHKQVIALCSQLGVDASTEAVKTPKQTRDSAPKEVRPFLEKIMRNVTGRSPGKLKLVPAEKSKAARAFKQRK